MRWDMNKTKRKPYEQYKGQYISKYDLLIELWRQQEYGSVQDSRGRAKAILTIMDFPYVECEDNNELYGK